MSDGVSEMILKKGYYVASGDQIVSERLETPEEAEAAWKDARRGAAGARFFIVWIPFDNYAWGE